MAAERGLIPGSVDLLVLRLLESTGAPLHGFAVARALEERSGGVLELKDAALYQALHRLEGLGFLAAEWGLSENNRRAKYYRITRAGAKHLTAESRRFREQAAAVLRVLGAEES